MTTEQETALVNERAAMDLERIKGRNDMKNRHRAELKSYDAETRTLLSRWRYKADQALKV